MAGRVDILASENARGQDAGSLGSVSVRRPAGYKLTSDAELAPLLQSSAGSLLLLLSAPLAHDGHRASAPSILDHQRPRVHSVVSYHRASVHSAPAEPAPVEFDGCVAPAGAADLEVGRPGRSRDDGGNTAASSFGLTVALHAVMPQRN